MEEIRIGIVGLGEAAQNYHIPVLSKFKDVKIEAVAEIDDKRRKRIVKQWNIPHNYKHDIEMYKKSNLDAVFVCVPDFLHNQIVGNALEDNLHIFCEKPFGMSSDRAYDFAKTAYKRNLVLTVGYNSRLIKNFTKAALIIQNMRLGKITHINGCFLLRGPYVGYLPTSDWFFKEKSGGVLYDIGCHFFDIITYILSEKIANVSAQSMNILHLETIDNIAGVFKTERSTLGTFSIGWQAAKDVNPLIQIYGTGGSLLIDPIEFEETYASHKAIEKVMWHLRNARAQAHCSLEGYRKRSQVDETYIKEDRTFIDSIKGKGKPIVLIDDAIHILEVLEAIKESVEKKKMCKVKHHSRVYTSKP